MFLSNFIHNWISDHSSRWSSTPRCVTTNTSTWPVSYLENVNVTYPFPFTAHHTDTILFYRCFTYYCNSSLLPLIPLFHSNHIYSRVRTIIRIYQRLRLITISNNSIHNFKFFTSNGSFVKFIKIYYIYYIYLLLYFFKIYNIFGFEARSIARFFVRSIDGSPSGH